MHIWEDNDFVNIAITENPHQPLARGGWTEINDWRDRLDIIKTGNIAASRAYIHRRNIDPTTYRGKFIPINISYNPPPSFLPNDPKRRDIWVIRRQQELHKVNRWLAYFQLPRSEKLEDKKFYELSRENAARRKLTAVERISEQKKLTPLKAGHFGGRYVRANDYLYKQRWNPPRAGIQKKKITPLKAGHFGGRYVTVVRKQKTPYIHTMQDLRGEGPQMATVEKEEEDQYMSADEDEDDQPIPPAPVFDYDVPASLTPPKIKAAIRLPDGRLQLPNGRILG